MLLCYAFVYSTAAVCISDTSLCVFYQVSDQKRNQLQEVRRRFCLTPSEIKGRRV